MSKMIQCDECKKTMFTDSREEKGAYISVSVEDPLFGYSALHLCRKCFEKKFPWLMEDNE